MAETSARLYRDYTRYLRPVRPVSFTDIEMLQSVVQCLDPEDIASVAQLLGTRRGVVRITMKTIEGIARLEDAVQRRRLTVAGSPFGIVEDGGQFILVQLDNVPQYVTDEQVEQEMAKYGVVASCCKDYVEVRGCRIENERRSVLFTMVFNRAAINGGELKMFGVTVYAKTPYDDLQAAHGEEVATTSVSAATGTNSAESGDRCASIAPSDSNQLPQPSTHARQHQPHSSTTPSGARLGGTSKTSADGSSSWKKATILATIQGVGDVHQPLAADHVVSTANSSTAVSGDHQHATTDQLTTRMGVRHSIVGGRSGVVHVGADARQRQKRTEAFEQLSAFLQ